MCQILNQFKSVHLVQDDGDLRSNHQMPENYAQGYIDKDEQTSIDHIKAVILL